MQSLPPLAIWPCPPQISGHVFCSARHQSLFWLLGMELAETLQQAPMGSDEFWAATKPEKAVAATSRVEYSMVAETQSINV